MAWRVPGGGSGDLAALDVVTRALVSRSTSRLNRALVGRDEPAAFVQGGLEVRKEAGLLYAVVVLTPGSDSTALAAVEARVLEELQDFVENPIDDAELAAVRREIENTTRFSRQRSRDLAMALGTAHIITGDVRKVDRRLAALERLKGEDVARVAKRYLTAQNRTVVWMQPRAAGAQGVNR
jgi:predicted Zn-dependent peptidase